MHAVVENPTNNFITSDRIQHGSIRRICLKSRASILIPTCLRFFVACYFVYIRIAPAKPARTRVLSFSWFCFVRAKLLPRAHAAHSCILQQRVGVHDKVKSVKWRVELIKCLIISVLKTFPHNKMVFTNGFTNMSPADDYQGKN